MHCPRVPCPQAPAQVCSGTVAACLRASGCPLSGLPLPPGGPRAGWTQRTPGRCSPCPGPGDALGSRVSSVWPPRRWAKGMVTLILAECWGHPRRPWAVNLGSTGRQSCTHWPPQFPGALCHSEARGPEGPESSGLKVPHPRRPRCNISARCRPHQSRGPGLFPLSRLLAF